MTPPCIRSRRYRKAVPSAWLKAEASLLTDGGVDTTQLTDEETKAAERFVRREYLDFDIAAVVILTMTEWYVGPLDEDFDEMVA